MALAQSEGIPDPTPVPEAQDELPSFTTIAGEHPGPQNGAIVPTATGQVGINPADLPSPSCVSPMFQSSVVEGFGLTDAQERAYWG